MKASIHGAFTVKYCGLRNFYGIILFNPYHQGDGTVVIPTLWMEKQRKLKQLLKGHATTCEE